MFGYDEHPYGFYTMAGKLYHECLQSHCMIVKSDLYLLDSISSVWSHCFLNMSIRVYKDLFFFVFFVSLFVFCFWVTYIQI